MKQTRLATPPTEQKTSAEIETSQFTFHEYTACNSISALLHAVSLKLYQNGLVRKMLNKAIHLKQQKECSMWASYKYGLEKYKKKDSYCK